MTSDAPSARSNLPIGIFDSGVGGLTVMRAIADMLPDEHLAYLGDTARVPYGNRAPETVRRYAHNATLFLEAQGIKALVIACNTATAFALDHLRDMFPHMPVVGVVDPVSRRAAAHTKTGTVGVIGTRGTVKSGVYESALKALGVQTVVQQPCPLFVPLAEEGWTEGDVTHAVASEYLDVFQSQPIDTLILGCTHYPLLAPTIASVIDAMAPRPVELLDSASATAAALDEVLNSRDLRRTDSASRRIVCYATDDPESFRMTATRFFGSELRDVQHVDILDAGSTDG